MFKQRHLQASVLTHRCSPLNSGSCLRTDGSWTRGEEERAQPISEQGRHHPGREESCMYIVRCERARGSLFVHLVSCSQQYSSHELNTGDTESKTRPLPPGSSGNSGETDATNKQETIFQGNDMPIPLQRMLFPLPSVPAEPGNSSSPALISHANTRGGLLSHLPSLCPCSKSHRRLVTMVTIVCSVLSLQGLARSREKPPKHLQQERELVTFRKVALSTGWRVD